MKNNNEISVTCNIKLILINGLRKLFKQINLIFQEDQIQFILPTNDHATYRYSKLDYDENTLELYGDGIKIEFENENNIVNKLKLLILEKKKNKKNKLSGPINTLTTPTKIYKETQLNLTSTPSNTRTTSPLKISPSSTTVISTSNNRYYSNDLNHLKANYTPEKSATVVRQNITPDSSREKKLQSHQSHRIENISVLPTPKSYNTPPRQDSLIHPPPRNLVNILFLFFFLFLF